MIFDFSFFKINDKMNIKAFNFYRWKLFKTLISRALHRALSYMYSRIRSKINTLEHMVCTSSALIIANIYITEKAYSKSLEHNVVYIPIITSSHSTSHDVK